MPAATTAGTGPLVAVVDPYHYDAAASDLAAYRSAYGLPACGADGTARPCFREIDEHGGTTFVPEPATDNWSGETALDLQMVSAACPSCRLLLVSASSEQALVTAIAQAVAQGAQYVSMSFGGPARRVSSTLFQQWPDVLFTAAAGDLGYQGADWPNEATHVLAIGGVRDAHGRLSAWNDAYGGTNAGCARPDKAGITPRMPVQQRATRAVWATCGNAHKAETDLSAIADPRTGVANYVEGHWYEAGGTSAAAGRTQAEPRATAPNGEKEAVSGGRTSVPSMRSPPRTRFRNRGLHPLRGGHDGRYGRQVAVVRRAFA